MPRTRALQVIALLGLLPVGCKTQVAADGCGNDNDCKGDRVCEAGRCVSPPGPSTGEPPPLVLPPPPVPPMPPPAPTQEAPAAAKAVGAPRIGARVPLVVVTEFGDFQCPYCARSTTVTRQILETWGKPDGAVAFEWRHNPLDSHPRALALARAAAAANLQGRFWQLHDQLFANPTALDEADLQKYAAAAGLDATRFEADRAAPALADLVQHDRKVAQALGAAGTPCFFVNGRRMTGMQPFEEMKKVIEEELGKAKALQDGGAKPESVAEALTRQNGPDYARYVLDGAPPPDAPKRSIPVEQTVWKVPVGSDDPALGSPEALVTLVEFGDFECPFCAKLAPVLKAVLDAHPKEVRLVFKQNPLAFHKSAGLAAQAALAAHAQGRFWAFHDRLFAHQDHLSREDLTAHAAAIGLDVPRFTKDLDGGTLQARVEADQDVAARASATGTPNTFINGRKVVGGRDEAELRALVEEELAKARALVASGTAPAAVYAKIVEGGKRQDPLGADEVRFALDAAPARGEPGAPIQLVLFADFQCPFSSRLEPILERVEAAFPGKVRTIFKHFPQPFHANAQVAAEAAVCAQEQGKFWEVYAGLFAAQKDLTDAAIEAAGTAAKLDLKAWKACRASDRPKKVVAADAAEAQQAGLKGTPTVFLNGKRFQSPTGYNDKSFTRIFEELLAK